MTNYKKQITNWKGKTFSYFSNRACEYFPCHDVTDKGNFNCLFCFCPLYNLVDCGGDYSYLHNEPKDCSNCTLPHDKNNYGYIVEQLYISDKEKQ